MLSARDLGPVKDLVATIGPNAQAGTVEQAAAFGDVVLISVPWPALIDIAKANGAALKGKVILDTNNPTARRDGPASEAPLAKGVGTYDQELFPGTKLVRAFNSIGWTELAAQAHRAGEPVGIELGADDAGAMEIAKQLVTDAGFEPVVVGNLAKSKLFDPGTPVYPKTMTAKEMKAALNL
jgi:predicted dinucleotide-binding enzyme